jgi:hypothetical protein
MNWIRKLSGVVGLIGFLGAANFFAALGGGTILGKAMGVLESEPLLKGDSLMALLVGTAVGLGLIIAVRKREGLLAGWFSLGTGLLSLVLLLILVLHADAIPAGLIAWLFFAILVFRWAFWSVGRTLRAEVAGRLRMTVPWVELLYYVGTVLGLSLWVFSGVNVSLRTALIIDLCLQLVAAGLDWAAARLPVQDSQQAPASCPACPSPLPLTTGLYTRLVVVAVSMTAAVQIVLFGMAHSIGEGLAKQGLTPSVVLAVFYSGAAVAALLCVLGGIKLEWSGQNQNAPRRASLVVHRLRHRRVPLITVLLCAAALTVAAVLSVRMTWMPPLLVLLPVAAATVCLGVVTLPAFNYIGGMSRAAGRPGKVSLAFGIMCLTGALVLLSIVSFGDSPEALVSVVIGGLLLSLAASVPWATVKKALPAARTSCEVGCEAGS